MVGVLLFAAKVSVLLNPARRMQGTPLRFLHSISAVGSLAGGHRIGDAA
jgi:hypothetical protein